MSAKQGDKKPEHSVVVERSCAVLRMLGRYGHGGARLVDITETTALTRPAALRILRSLCAEGVVYQNDKRRYALGPLIYQLGLSALSPLGDIEPVRAIVRDLAHLVGDTAYLCMRSGDYGHYLVREEGSFPVRTHFINVGDIKPLVDTYGGITLLSSMTSVDADDILKRLLPESRPEEQKHRENIFWMLRQAKKTGYVYGSNLVLDGVAGLGIPILAAGNMPFLALTISAISSRLENDRIDDVYQQVALAAEKIAMLILKSG